MAAAPAVGPLGPPHPGMTLSGERRVAREDRPEIPRGLRGHRWAAPGNFLGLEPADAGWADAAAVVLPVPYEATTSYGGGTREGPGAILEASRYVELYDETLDAHPYEAGVCTLPGVELTGAGPEAAVAQLRDLYADLLEAAGGRLVIALGGEHSISSAPIAMWARRLDGDLSVLQLDAHSDLRDRWDDTPWSHACVMRRALEALDAGGHPGSGRVEGGAAAGAAATPADDATEAPAAPGPIAAVGIRALTSEERSLIRDRRLETAFSHQMREDGWQERVLGALGENVDVTFDVDFFDPSLVPATGTPEPGGGTWWQAVDLLESVFRERNVVGVDVVELSGGHAASAFLVARLVYRMIGYHARARGRI